MALSPQEQRPPFWRDERVLRVIGQIAFLIALVLFVALIYSNMIAGLRSQGMTIGFDFLKQMSSFDIGESLIEYSRTSTYTQAYFVGFLNTLLVAALGVVLATILGIVIGVARLSGNVLVSGLAKVYIELFRNVSLLVFLIFWYTGIFLKFPRVQEANILWDAVLLTNRGVGIPWGIPQGTFQTFVGILIFGLVVAVIVSVVLTQQGKKTGRMPLVSFWSTLSFLVIAVIGWFVLPEVPLSWELPYVKGLNLAGGRILSPEFMALLSGLVIYTAAFIAEVVRAGILSVSKGQWEAARALGLSAFETLRLVVFPQALRVIVPPLTSQYLNLTKNSSLAVAIGYPDVFYVSGTVINQSGRAVEMISIVMLTYLTFSLLTSAFMNWYNQKIKLVER